MGAQIRLGVCSTVECEGYDNAMACILVPGEFRCFKFCTKQMVWCFGKFFLCRMRKSCVFASLTGTDFLHPFMSPFNMIFLPGNRPTSSGQHIIFEPIELHQPSSGVRIVLVDGEMCAVTRKPRKTFVNFYVSLLVLKFEPLLHFCLSFNISCAQHTAERGRHIPRSFSSNLLYLGTKILAVQR